MDKLTIRTQQHIRNFEKTLAEYQFDEPFSRFLTQFYRNNKQMGSSDRRMNSRYCYNYFRLGKAFEDLPAIQRLQIAEFLCETQSAVITVLLPEWADKLQDSLKQKVTFIESIYGSFLDRVFPVSMKLSNGIDTYSFVTSHFIQPDLFIRVKRSKSGHVRRELTKQEISFTQLSDQTFVLPNGTNLQNMNYLQGSYEVQDWASQQTINSVALQSGDSWWDCCAASGGKSLMMLDQEPNIKLLVSDIRMSILRNLDERFEKAEIKTPYRKKILDLSTPVDANLLDEKFDGILIDAPCSGSGTWGRTPEMLSKFNQNEVIKYSELQKKIASHAVPFLKKGKSLIYITCSVFSEENEEVVQFIADQLNMQLIATETILGYDKKADSMFVARFIKPL